MKWVQYAALTNLGDGPLDRVPYGVLLRPPSAVRGERYEEFIACVNAVSASGVALCLIAARRHPCWSCSMLRSRISASGLWLFSIDFDPRDPEDSVGYSPNTNGESATCNNSGILNDCCYSRAYMATISPFFHVTFHGGSPRAKTSSIKERTVSAPNTTRT